MNHHYLHIGAGATDGSPESCDGSEDESTTTSDTLIKKKYVSCTLDDTPIVTPANSAFGNKFVKAYKNARNFLDVKLAIADPHREKAFENSTNGTVLGVQFNTKNMSWSISSKSAKKLKI